MYNFRTGSKEYISSIEKITDEMAKSYIPQYEVAINLYEVNRAMGMSIIDSLVSVLRIIAGAARIRI